MTICYQQFYNCVDSNFNVPLTIGDCAIVYWSDRKS